MEDNFIHKLMEKAKVRFSKKNNSNSEFLEYAFSTEEIDDLSKENKKKILELKQDLFSTAEYKKKKNKIEPEIFKEEVKPVKKEKQEDSNLGDATAKQIENPDVNEREEKIEDTIQKHSKMENDLCEEQEKNENPILELENVQHKNSFIHLNEDYQKIVMEKWNSIDIIELDRDILYGKDLLNHNYTITYPDDAARFIHKIRKEYEVVICYLIGFNNEKKGIYDKTIFSSKTDDEWHYLSQYIKILEKIRSSKK